MQDDPTEHDESPVPPEAVRPLDYGRASYEPKPLVVLPLLIGIIGGFICVVVFGLVCLGGVANAGRNSGAAIGIIYVFAILIVIVIGITVRHVRSQPRNWYYWFVLGLLLGAGTMMLFDGVCFAVLAR